MKEVFTKLLYEMEKGRDAVLTTLVDGSGSTPGKTGCQMLVTAKGRLAGTVGGGAIEKLSEETSIELIGQKMSSLRKFDLRDSAVGGIGMACGGETTAFFQYITAGDAIWNSIALAVIEAFKSGRKATLRLKLSGKPASLEAADGGLLAGEEAGADERTFDMPLPLGERVVIFGGGHIALALVPLLRSIDFRPVVFDDRPEFAVIKRFPEAEQVVLGDFTNIAESLVLSPEDYIVVMTNAHTHDFEVQRQILRDRYAYVGVIGSAKKAAAINAKLREAGVCEKNIASVHTPIGLPIRATTPAEIAVSVAAQMILERRNNMDCVGFKQSKEPTV